MSESTAPGIVSGHAKLAGGAAEAAFGSLTGNANLQSSGEALKQSGVDELKAYQSAHPPSGNASSLEAKVGSAVGCEGLVNDAQGSTTGSTGSSLSNTNSVSAASGVGGVIKDDGSANAGLQDILAGGVQPGKGTGGASGAAGEQPERLV